MDPFNAAPRVVSIVESRLSIGARNLFDTYPGQARLDYNNNLGVFPRAAVSRFGYNGRFLFTRVTWTMPSRD